MSNQAQREFFSRIGGHPALDLVNTVEWRLSPARRVDDVDGYEDILRWAGQLELMSTEDGEVLRRTAARAGAAAAEEFERVRALREDLYATLFDGGDPAVVMLEYAEVVDGGNLARVGKSWDWDLGIDLTLPRRRIALEAFDLLTASNLSLLSQCQDAECGWVFLDTSPRHNRRWCVAADCGNRNRARDFYRRAR